MPIVNPKKVQPVNSPANVPKPDRIVDPFTITPLDSDRLSPKTRELLEDWQKNRIGDDYDYDMEMIDLERTERFAYLADKIGQGQFRVGAPNQLIGPDGKPSERTKRPDDFASANEGEPISPMEPSKPFENSPFWHTNIGSGCFPNVASYELVDENQLSTQIAAAIPNSFPFFDAQELIVFPHSRALSISQLNPIEIKALGALLQDRYRAMQEAGHEFVWFGMHRGQDGGGTLEHLHFQVYGSDIAPRTHANIWANEVQLGLSHFEFQRLRGELTISKDSDRNAEIFSPYTGGFPLGMGIAYTKEDPNAEYSRGPTEYIHLDDMSSDDLTNWLKSLAQAVETIEGIPLKNRANGLAGYSISCVIPPKGSNLSPMTWNVNPAKLRSVPFEQFDGLENPINPFNARDILTRTLTCPGLERS